MDDDELFQITESWSWRWRRRVLSMRNKLMNVLVEVGVYSSILLGALWISDAPNAGFLPWLIAGGLTFVLLFVVVQVLKVLARRAWDRGQPVCLWQISGMRRSPTEAALDGMTVLRPVPVRIRRNVPALVFWLLFQLVAGHSVIQIATGKWSLWLALPAFFSSVTALYVAWAAFDYLLLSCFRPRPIIWVSAAVVPAGGDFDLQWEVRGPVRRIDRVKIELRAHAYTFDERRLFWSHGPYLDPIPVVDVERPEALKSGSAIVQVPANAVVSRIGRDAAVLWMLSVSIESSPRRSVDAEFPIQVFAVV